VAGVREYWREISKEKKLFSIFSVSILLFCIGYAGIGYVVAQSLAANPGCGMWSENSPSDWDVDDDWESFDPWPDAEERVEIRRDFDASEYQMSTFEEVTFSPRDNSNIALSGWYVEVDPNAPVVIQTHGMPMNGKCKPEMLLMQGYLAEGGINSLSFDLRNYGNSEVVDDYIGVGQKEYRDILGAYDWLVSEKGYEPGEVGIIGISAGGSAAIAFADEPGIGAMWLDSAVLDFPLVVKNELERLGFPTFFAGPGLRVGGWLAGVDLDARSAMEAADNAGERPVFLTHAIEDPRVSVVHSERFETKMLENGGNVTTWYVEDRGHVDAIWGESEEYSGLLTSFFNSALVS
tara:strand:- start:12911 stop:13957 length:1047 start_codon:yes stop_codon:yes gene_type:complete